MKKCYLKRRSFKTDIFFPEDLAAMSDSLNQDQRMMYQQLVSLNNLDVTLYWTRSQLFFFVHSAGISLTATLIENTHVRISVCCLGVIVAVLWWLVSAKVRQFMRFWHKKLAELESAKSLQKIQVFSDREFLQIRERGIPDVYYLMNWLIAIFICVWIGLAFLPSLTEVLP